MIEIDVERILSYTTVVRVETTKKIGDRFFTHTQALGMRELTDAVDVRNMLQYAERYNMLEIEKMIQNDEVQTDG